MQRLALLSLVLLAGCSLVSPEARIRDRLLAAGVKPRLAECLAGRLADRLSDGELRELDRVTKMPHDGGHLKLRELADRLQALDDPHIVDVVTGAGLGCAVAG